MGVADSALDDVCQDVFVVVHRRLPEFRGQSTLKTWVFGILMNVVQVHRRTVQRKSPRHASRETGIDPDSLADERYKQPDQRAASAEAARVAHELLAELADDQRAVFILAEIEEMPVTEVAHAVGANLNTVYARLRAARKNFALAARRYRAKDRWRLR
jgi:RNA polymerase sigma-70 factor (ECF subfamily)